MLLTLVARVGNPATVVSFLSSVIYVHCTVIEGFGPWSPLPLSSVTRDERHADESFVGYHSPEHASSDQEPAYHPPLNRLSVGIQAGTFLPCCAEARNRESQTNMELSKEGDWARAHEIEEEQVRVMVEKL
jgi:hypothetical protein